MPTDQTHLESLAGGAEAATVAELAFAASEPAYLAGDRAASFILPAGARREEIDLERYLDEPRRKKGRVSLHTGQALADYTNAHKTDATTLWADVQQRNVTSVLDDHADELAGWADHRAVLQLRHTPAWQRWVKHDGQKMSQVAFAEHLEDGISEIVEPSGADMLELAKSFQATKGVTFRSDRRLDNGQVQVQYEETIDAKAGQRGDLLVPQTFVLALQPFEGSDTYRVQARLRYRLGDGSLTIGYVLDRPEDVIRSAFDDVLAGIEKATELTAYRGTPRS